MNTRVLAIGAHPDDIELGCGGTIRLLADKGYEIIFVVVTSGEEGSLNMNKMELLNKRRTEARASAKILGATEVIFLNEPDGLTRVARETKLKLIQIIRQYKPDMAFIHSTYDCLSDHQIISQLSTAAIHAASGPWYPTKGLQHHQVSEIFGFEVWNPIQRPQLNIDITSTIDRKIKALSCHISQIESMDYVDAVRGLNRYRGVVSMSGTYAESFEVIQLTNL